MGSLSKIAVVFDLFGTLVPISPHLYRAMLHTMADAIGGDRERFAQAWLSSKRDLETGNAGGLESSVRFVAVQVGLRPTSSSVNQAADAWLETSRLRLAPSDRTLGCLEMLRRRGHKIGLLTNCGADIPRTWPDGELASLVNYAGFSWKLGQMKPEEGAYLSVCAEMGAAPESCIFVGDGGDRELTGAGKAGLHPVLLEYSPETGLGSNPLELLSAFGSHSDALDWTGDRASDLESAAGLLSDGSGV
ncbi:MAG: HAD hydrolase-like protein [Chloroflexi bacterium]|nr:HAD hydrolase-like protein [Chloroflexota bacterium]